MNVQVCARASAAGRSVAERPPRMHFGKTALLTMLKASGVDPNKVTSIRHLGNRVVCYNAGHRCVLA